MMERFISIKEIKSGDLLVWSKNPANKISDWIIKTVARLTKSEYGHVGIAWRCHDGLDDELFVIEATIPSIQVERLSEENHFFCVPMDIFWTNKNKQFLISKLGLPYGYMDALRAFLGITVEDDKRWQCAELARAFYRESGISFPDRYRPKDIVNAAVEISNNSIYRVIT